MAKRWMRGLAALLLAVGTASCTDAGDDAAPTPPTPSASSAGSGPRVTVLIHGLGGDPSNLETLAVRLRAEGYQPLQLALPLRGVVPIAESVAAVQAALRNATGPVDLVGYSLGGVVARAWVSRHGAESSGIGTVVTIASPHHGSENAARVLASDPSRCVGACAELAPGSAYLRALNRGDETPDGLRWVTLRTRADATVVPVDSAVLDGAVNVLLQDVCADSRVGHGGIAVDPLSVGLVVRALRGDLDATPPPSDCAAVRAEGRTR